jgi:ATP-dependent Clp protease ATP-binding subunit ClpC
MESIFSRFTERARQAILLAQEEAQRRNHAYLGTEHLMLGLLKCGGFGITTLQNMGLTIDGVRTEIERHMPRFTDQTLTNEVAFTPKAKKVLEHAVNEANAIKVSAIGTEHLLLGLLIEKGGVASIVLHALGIRPDKMREIIREIPNA